MSGDAGDNWPPAVRSELADGMAHEKCRDCGCMHDGLARSESLLEETGAEPALLDEVRQWQDDLAGIAVDCRGCSHCFPAEATNAAMDAVEDVPATETGGCIRPTSADSIASSPATAESTAATAGWPPVPGEYHAVCTGTECPVAVSTLGDSDLAEQLAAAAPAELCMVGRTKTENSGIEKLLKNVVANPTIQTLVLAGPELEGHQTGGTLKALLDSGVTEEMRVVDAPGRRPVLANTTPDQVRQFREQVDIVDLIGCSDPETIVETVVAEAETDCTCGDCLSAPATVTEVPHVEADPNETVRMDPAGYFVILPQPQKGTIVGEHYDYDHERQRTIEGDAADDIYREIVERGLVTRLDHAAYLGAELARAELAITEGYEYEQDGKPG